MLVLIASHGFYHLLANANRWLQHGLCRWILPKDESKVNVEQVTGFINHQILQMSVANSHQVRNRAIASAALDIGVKNVFILFLIKYRLGHRLLASRGRDLRGDGGRLAFKEIFNLVLVCLQYLLNSV